MKNHFTGAEPQIFVTDMARAIEFYTQKLKFEIAFVHGEPPFYAQVYRERARLNLRHVDAPVIDPTLREAEQLLAASITVDYADGIYFEFQAAGVTFTQFLKTEDWNARTFIVRDPDGNLLLFAGRDD